uniref:Uncharacterized protein n=1 Tax=Setaria italica TaxID=4555 RepID=K3YAV1_SETIT
MLPPATADVLGQILLACQSLLRSRRSTPRRDLGIGMSGRWLLRGCRPGPAAVAGRPPAAVPEFLLFGIDDGAFQFALLNFDIIFPVFAPICEALMNQSFDKFPSSKMRFAEFDPTLSFLPCVL